MDLGQDPDTFRGEPVWESAERAGLKVGIFGAMQSWPPRQLAHGGFWIPDTFARTAETVPASLATFQEFNLSMTAENTFSSTSALDAKRMAIVGRDLVTLGLTPRSAALLARQVLRERRDARWKAARPMAQVLPAFDLYWRLQRRVHPQLSIFFTNHVAGMMHRYWGDGVPGYTADHDYQADQIFGRFLLEALDLCDAHLRRILRYANRNPETVLIIASSMGQAAVEYQHVGDTYVLRDAERLVETLGLPPAALGLAMYPRYALEFADVETAEKAGEAIRGVRIESRPFFTDMRIEGRTVSAMVPFDLPAQPDGFSIGPDDHAVSLAELGFSIEERLGGGNTAYHIPQGIWIAHGEGIPAGGNRTEFSALEAKQRILSLLGVDKGDDHAVAPGAAAQA